jgi:hypothetical protein
MKILKFNDEGEWLEARRGKITGSRLKDIVSLRGGGKKVGYYQLIAERLSNPATDEKPMDRGHRLESVAIEQFVEHEGKAVCTDLVMWTRDDVADIAVSPDGYIETDGKITEAVEIKCLNSAAHIEAKLTGEIPKEYEFQVLQYFIVNPDLELLNFCFYDPRFIDGLQFHIIKVLRTDIEVDIETYLAYQLNTLAEINKIVSDLTLK